MNTGQVTRLMMRMVMRYGLGPVTRRLMGAGSGDDSPENRARRKQADQTARRARQAMRVTRRMGRF